jgi:hypothetical protein
MKRRLTKWVTWYMLLVMFLIGITPKVYAGFSPSEDVLLSPTNRAVDLQKVQKVLESKMIRERLRQLGFTEEGIQNRLMQLSDEQIHRLALKLDELTVAGDTGEAILIVLLIAVIVVLVLYIMGYRVILKK